MIVGCLVAALVALSGAVVGLHVQNLALRADLRAANAVAERRGNSGPIIGRHVVPEAPRRGVLGRSS